VINGDILIARTQQANISPRLQHLDSDISMYISVSVFHEQQQQQQQQESLHLNSISSCHCRTVFYLNGVRSNWCSALERCAVTATACVRSVAHYGHPSHSLAVHGTDMRHCRFTTVNWARSVISASAAANTATRHCSTVMS